MTSHDLGYNISQLSKIADNLTDDELKKYLLSLDWTLKSANMEKFTHNIHIYPARMVPDLVGRLIAVFSQKHETVFDPFCGSATILLESMLLGRNSFGIDINPLAIKIGRVKTTILETKQIHYNYHRVINLISNKSAFNKYNKEKKVKFTDIIYWIDRWFQPQVQEKLYRLGKAIETISDPKIRNFFEIIYSNTARNVSNNRNSSYKNYRINNEKLENYNPSVYKIFQQYYDKSVQGMEELENYFINDGLPLKPTIQCKNILSLDIPPSSVDLIVSSPPYGDSSTTVGYGQFSKFSMAWLNMNKHIGSKIDREGLGGEQKILNKINSKVFYQIQNKVKKNEIDLKNKRHISLHQFFNDFQLALVKITRALQKNRYICLVLGNRTMREIRIPMDIITREILENLSFEHWLTLYRDIPNKRHPPTQKLYVDPKWLEAQKLDLQPVKIENIQKETILIMKKVHEIF